MRSEWERTLEFARVFVNTPSIVWKWDLEGPIWTPFRKKKKNPLPDTIFSLSLLARYTLLPTERNPESPGDAGVEGPEPRRAGGTQEPEFYPAPFWTYKKVSSISVTSWHIPLQPHLCGSYYILYHPSIASSDMSEDELVTDMWILPWPVCGSTVCHSKWLEVT